MWLIYSPTGMTEGQEALLEAALAHDQARIHYQGNDGTDEYVIMQAPSFKHTETVGRSLGLSLALTRGRRRTRRSRQNGNSS